MRGGGRITASAHPHIVDFLAPFFEHPPGLTRFVATRFYALDLTGPMCAGSRREIAKSRERVYGVAPTRAGESRLDYTCAASPLPVPRRITTAPLHDRARSGHTCD